MEWNGKFDLSYVIARGDTASKLAKAPRCAEAMLLQPQWINTQTPCALPSGRTGTFTLYTHLLRRAGSF